MLYLRVVKGVVNFIVLLLGFGVDAGDRLVLVVSSSPRNIQCVRSKASNKGKGGSVLEGPGAGWGARQGALQCQRPLS